MSGCFCLFFRILFGSQLGHDLAGTKPPSLIDTLGFDCTTKYYFNRLADDHAFNGGLE